MSLAKKLTYLKWAIQGPFFFIFVFSKQLVIAKQMFYIKMCQRLDLNCGPLVSGATALPTEPQPLPKIKLTLAFLCYFCKCPHREQQSIHLVTLERTLVPTCIISLYSTTRTIWIILLIHLNLLQEIKICLHGHLWVL